MAVAELFLAAFLQVLFDRLASREVLSCVGLCVGLEKKLGKWRSEIEIIEKVLNDADKKEPTIPVEQLLDNLREFAYDVDDILDEFATEASLCKLRGENKVRKLIPACYKINKITARFNSIFKEINDLGLGKEGGDPSGASEDTEQSGCLEKGYRVFGRERDKKAVLEFLLSKKYNNDADNNVAEVPVISIYGMAGVGKTTLAKLVYGDKDVESHFDVIVWAYVGKFHLVNNTIRIFEFVNRGNKGGKKSKPKGTTNLALLQDELKNLLCGKKFLLILDDVRTLTYKDWNELRAPFLDGTPESRIIVTTCSQVVSSIVMDPKTNVPAHHLQLLSDEECFSVFTLHAPDLGSIDKEISRKFKGLPLAAVNFASLLHSERDPKNWKDASDEKIFLEILSKLIVSYKDLPSNIKRCFAYCSILPEDYKFEEKQLVLLWMAEGFIQPGKEQMEDSGSKYFQELVKKSLFQKSSNDDESRFTMHSFINKLALRVARDMCFRMDDRLEDSNKQENFKRARHLSYLCSHHHNCRKNFEALSKLKRLRTFLPLLPQEGYSLTCDNVSLQLLSKLRRIRVLSLRGYNTTELPKSIGDLKHLRYLDLSNTSIQSMPESTTNLYNLQTLILENCRALKKLPSKFWKLVNLRHLNIQNTSLLEEMPLQMGKLTCLQTLSNFVVGKGLCSGVKELGPLSHLRETLHISRLENVIQLEDAKDANLIQKATLGGLLLEWNPNLDEPQERTIFHFEVLNKLQPHEGLKDLTIKCFGGTEFPTWLRHPSFPNMVRLKLENCKKCTSLPPVGRLSLLKDLSIIGMDRVEKVGPEFYERGVSQPFGSLETLYFESMEKWAAWIPCGEFPHLRKLSIQNCPKLSGKLPDLPLLETYEINGCPLLQERPRIKVVHDSPQAESSV